jgi:hypothetical protein
MERTGPFDPGERESRYTVSFNFSRETRVSLLELVIIFVLVCSYLGCSYLDYILTSTRDETEKRPIKENETFSSIIVSLCRIDSLGLTDCPGSNVCASASLALLLFDVTKLNATALDDFNRIAIWVVRERQAFHGSTIGFLQSTIEI